MVLFELDNFHIQSPMSIKFRVNSVPFPFNSASWIPLVFCCTCFASRKRYEFNYFTYKWVFMLFVSFPEPSCLVGTQFTDIVSHPTTMTTVWDLQKMSQKIPPQGKNCNCFLNIVSILRNHDLDTNKRGKLLSKADLLCDQRTSSIQIQDAKQITV